jgi:hypothetical protein
LLTADAVGAARARTSSMTVEELLDAEVLPASTATALRERYIVGCGPVS